MEILTTVVVLGLLAGIAAVALSNLQGSWTPFFPGPMVTREREGRKANPFQFSEVEVKEGGNSVFVDVSGKLDRDSVLRFVTFRKP